MSNTTLYITWIHNDIISPLIMEATIDNTTQSFPLDISSRNCVAIVGVQVVYEDVRTGRNTNVEIWFLLIAEREWLIIVAVGGNEDCFADGLSILGVGSRLAEVANALRVVDAGIGG